MDPKETQTPEKDALSSAKEKAAAAKEALAPVQGKMRALWDRYKPTGLKGYAIRTALVNTLCLVLAVYACHFFFARGMDMIALCLLVVLAGVIVHANIMFALDMREPIMALTDLAKRIAAGGYGLQAAQTGNDEIGELTAAINNMSTKISQSEKVQAEFISSVSHELRTPLTAITGWSETMLFDESITGDSRRGLEIIGREAGRLTNMVNDLLEFTRIQDGRFKLTMELVDITAELEDAMMAYSDLLSRENMTMRYAVPDTMAPLINGDPERLRQVFLNILDNAAKYGKGSKTVDIAVTYNTEYISISFRDHGPGIPENELAHVKEKFFKGSSHVRGNGIGLAVCDEIVTRHGGELLVANAEGGGALITVKLPVSDIHV